MLKHGIIGIYHQVSFDHLQRIAMNLQHDTIAGKLKITKGLS